MTSALVLGAVVVLLGAVVQGAAGYGMNLLAAPVLTLVDPQLVPVPLLLLSSTHAVLAAIREHTHVDWRGVAWTMAGRLPGTAIGVLIVVLLPQGPFSIVVGIAVLTCVVLSLTAWHPRPRPPALVIGGLAGGTFGTAATTGGPPVAILYQHERGPIIRSTMAMYFLCGSLISVAGLALGGQVDETALMQAAVLLPGMLLGFVLSNPVKKVLDTGWMRPTVLGISGLSATVLIARTVVG